MQARILKMQQKAQSPEWLMRIAECDAIKQKSNEEEAEKRRLARIQSSLITIPPCFVGKTFDDFVVSYEGQAKVKKIAENFVTSFTKRLEEGTCLKFLGESGRGKTLLSSIICQALSKVGFSIRYESSLRFLKIFQEKSFESSSSFESLLESYKRIQFLVLDEAGRGCGSGGYLAPWEQDQLYILINMRYVHQLPTLIISNHTNEELIERLGEPTVGRLSERGIALTFDWQSYRKK